MRVQVDSNGVVTAAGEALSPPYIVFPTNIAPGSIAGLTVTTVVDGRKVLRRNGLVVAIEDTTQSTTSSGGTSGGATRQGPRFISLGDSYSAGFGGAGIPWPERLCAILQQQLQFVRNAGIPGNNTGQMKDRLQADVLDYKPDIVSVLGGGNDAGQSLPLSYTQANITNIVERLIAAGVQPWLFCTLNRGNQLYLSAHMLINDWVRWYAKEKRLPCIDFFQLMDDPANGQLLPAYDFGDAVHPSQAGHRIMALHVASKIGSILPPYAGYRALSNVLDTNNLISNPFMLTGSPTPTGYVPSGTTMTGYTEQLATDADFLGGKCWEWNFNNPSNAAGFRSLSATCGGAAPAAGDLMLFTAQTKIVSQTNVVVAQNVGLRFNAVFVGATDPLQQISQLTYGDATVHGVELYSWRVRVPAGTTSVQLQAIQNLVPTNGQLTSRVGEFAAYNLTRMGQE